MTAEKNVTKILIATYNDNKRRELRELLKGMRMVVVMDYNDLGTEPPMVIEDGKTFRENAVKKAVVTSKFFDGFVLADDSGLEVDALGGRPGVRSARFARTNATDRENVIKLLNLMASTPSHKRTARFVCHVAFAKDGKLLEDFVGTIKGRLTEEPAGANGFGYDPVYIPDRYEKTFAEMAPEYKNKISHRSAALKRFKKAARKYLK